MTTAETTTETATDLAELGIVEGAAAVRAKTVSPSEWLEALLARIEAHDGKLDSVLLLDAENARAAAKAAELAVTAGGELGPLHGVPFGLKDIIDAAGIATTCHSRILIDNVAAADAAVTARLRAAGGVLVAKLATHEFAIGGPCFDLPWPPARNPWQREHFTGGSSSGSGAAVAARFLPGALGSDTGGSVRNPASACGLVGMKATYGAVPKTGVFPLSYSLDHVGPLSRTVADNAALLAVLMGPDAGDPTMRRAPARLDLSDLEAGVAGLTIGIVRHFFERDLEAHPAMMAGLEAALDVWRGQGATVVDVHAPPLDAFAACNRVVLLSEAYAVHRRWLQERPGDYGALTRQRILPGAFIAAVDYIEALRQRRALTARLDATAADVDVLVTLSSMDPPCRLDDAVAIERTYSRQARAPFNVTGWPACVIPSGFSDDGLPLSVQIAGRPWSEALIYRVARAHERESQWHRRAPSL